MGICTMQNEILVNIGWIVGLSRAQQFGSKVEPMYGSLMVQFRRSLQTSLRRSSLKHPGLVEMLITDFTPLVVLFCRESLSLLSGVPTEVISEIAPPSFRTHVSLLVRNLPPFGPSLAFPWHDYIRAKDYWLNWFLKAISVSGLAWAPLLNLKVPWPEGLYELPPLNMNTKAWGSMQYIFRGSKLRIYLSAKQYKP